MIFNKTKDILLYFFTILQSIFILLCINLYYIEFKLANKKECESGYDYRNNEEVDKSVKGKYTTVSFYHYILN